MYIAFKWLVGLAFTMWISVCIVDVYLKNTRKFTERSLVTPVSVWKYKNVTHRIHQVPNFPAQKYYKEKYQKLHATSLHYFMFFVGVIAVSVFNKKHEIISFTKSTIAKVDFVVLTIKLRKCFLNIFVFFGVAITKYAALLWGNSVAAYLVLKNMKLNLKSNFIAKHTRLNIILLEKLRGFSEERKKLGQLLIAAVRENKTISRQYQLETMAKNRLIKYIEELEKKIKENRTRYVNFQHLYIVTHQENIFLKGRIRKITQVKEDAEKDLMNIVDKVYQSKNNDLISYCSRFIVKPKENLLHTDVNAEVQIFLNKSQTRSDPTAQESDSDLSSANSKSLHTSVIHVLQSGVNLEPLVSEAPRLKGLPGECIWTVKDKDGLIEKLYECDFDTSVDNGDIRRIREYSVYFDKDCLLDFSRSRTVVSEINLDNLHSVYPTNERFLTGSEAFKNFLKNNKNIVPSSRSPSRSLLCV